MENTANTILETLRGYLASYAKKDLDACMAMFCEEGEFLVMGTSQEEVFTDRAALREAFRSDFETLSDMRFGDLTHSHVEHSDTLASAMMEIPLSFSSGGEHTSTLFRQAFTLRKESGQWRIGAFMSSLPSGPAAG